MNVKLKDGILSLTDFARNTRQHTDELLASGEARVLTQNGKAALVVLSAEVFEDLARDAEEHRMNLRLKQAVEDYASGDRGKPSAKAFRDMKKRAEKRRSGK